MGAAAGLASAFNTPLGGIVYAIEELRLVFVFGLSSFGARRFLDLTRGCSNRRDHRYIRSKLRPIAFIPFDAVAAQWISHLVDQRSFYEHVKENYIVIPRNDKNKL